MQNRLIKIRIQIVPGDKKTASEISRHHLGPADWGNPADWGMLVAQRVNVSPKGAKVPHVSLAAF